MKIAAAIAFLFFASLAQADTVTVNGAVVTIPEGSSVTSIDYIPPNANNGDPIVIVDFSFADGYGTAANESGYDSFPGLGNITFTVPVSNLTFTWDGVYYFEAGVASGSNQIGSFVYDPESNFGLASGVATFYGPDITSMQWDGFDGAGGITSMSYVEDTVEPGTFVLLAAGLLSLAGMFFRKSLV
jgi:hypothetical protein